MYTTCATLRQQQFVAEQIINGTEMSHTVNVSCYSKRQMERRAARSWSASSAGGQRAIINLQMTFYVGDLQIIKIVIKNYNSNFLFRSHTSKHFENIWDFFIQRIFHVSIKKVSHFFFHLQWKRLTNHLQYFLIFKAISLTLCCWWYTGMSNFNKDNILNFTFLACNMTRWDSFLGWNSRRL